MNESDWTRFVENLKDCFANDDILVALPGSHSVKGSSEVAPSSDFDVLFLSEPHNFSINFDPVHFVDRLSRFRRIADGFRDEATIVPMMVLESHLRYVQDRLGTPGMSLIHILSYPSAGCLLSWEPPGVIQGISSSNCIIGDQASLDLVHEMARCMYLPSEEVNSLLMKLVTSYVFLLAPNVPEELRISYAVKDLIYALRHLTNRHLRSSGLLKSEATTLAETVKEALSFSLPWADTLKQLYDIRNLKRHATEEYVEHLSVQALLQVFGSSNTEEKFRVKRPPISLLPHGTDVNLVVRDLLRTHNTPFFLCNIARLHSNLNTFIQTFRNHEIEVDVFYAAKANYSSPVLSFFREQGCGVEVMSPLELDLAIHCGYDPEHIVYTSIGKTEADIRKLAALGPRFSVVDSLREVEFIEMVLGSTHQSLNIALRVDPLEDPDCKFGLTKTEAMEVLRVIKTAKTMRLVAVHFHLGTRQDSYDQYRIAAEYADDLIKTIQYNTESSIITLDIGGGFPSPDVDGGSALDSCAAALHNGLHEHTGKQKLRIITEPGRAIVENAFTCIARVTRIKESKGKMWAILDVSLSHLPQLKSARYEYDVLTDSQSENKCSFELCGPLGMKHDVFKSNCLLPNLREGDAILVQKAGAYTVSLWNSFGYPHPQIVFMGYHAMPGKY